MAERLTSVDVGKMYLDRRSPSRGHGIAQADAGVRQPAGVDHDAMAGARLRLEEIDQRSLVIRLECGDRAAKLGTPRPYTLVDVIQGHMPVDFGLTPAERVQVRSVNHQHTLAVVGWRDCGHKLLHS